MESPYKPLLVAALETRLADQESRFNYDSHRASRLWVWPMLFVLAWSSVALNLNTEVYQPVMKLVFDLREPDDLPTLDKPLEAPALGWRAAYAHGQRLMTEAGPLRLRGSRRAVLVT